MSYADLTLKELQAVARKHALPYSGRRKAELIAMLHAHESRKSSARKGRKRASPKRSPKKTSGYGSMTVINLKKELSRRSLPIGHNTPKAVLIRRLEDDDRQKRLVPSSPMDVLVTPSEAVAPTPYFTPREEPSPGPLVLEPVEIARGEELMRLPSRGGFLSFFGF